MNDFSELIPRDLPSGMDLVSAGKAIGNDITMGISAFCRQHGVRSELEYKLKMAQAGRSMTALTIGLQDWPDTQRGLEKIYSHAQERGFYIDRFILALDRRMGLPADQRADAIKETGPLLTSDQDWNDVAQTVAIQPHMGDMMIGSPASVDNTVRALTAGVNYIGNLSQFAWKYQSWPGTDIEQMSEVVKALGIMASKAADGAVVHSYLDDGFPAQFSDYSSYIGWAKFERYVVEELIGAQLGIAYGGLTHSPVTKSLVIMALESFRPKSVASSFYYSNTTRYSTILEKNYGILGVDVLQMMLVDRKVRAGAAIMPVPVTEAIRIPSPDEILDVQTVAHQIAHTVDDIFPTITWDSVEKQSHNLVIHGTRFFDNMMNGFLDAGIDIRDPLALLVAARRLGARGVERAFGVGTPTEDPAFDGYEPLIPTDTLNDFLAERTRVRQSVRPSNWVVTRSLVAVVASSDVHEVGMRLVIDAVENLDIKPIIGGVGADPEEIAQLAQDIEATTLLISTHNGMALSYATKLMSELASRDIAPQVIFGGRLNQDVEGQDMPVDVTDELINLGIHVCLDLTKLAEIIEQ